MEENQLSQDSEKVLEEPSNLDDNSAETGSEENLSGKKAENTAEKHEEGKSSDSSGLILGKFKSMEDLTEAYKQLEKLQGNQSSELGALREFVASVNNGNEVLKLFETLYQDRTKIQEAAAKYPDYFSDPSFKQIFSEAYRVLGSDLDIDRLVTLIDGYVSSRIFAYEKSKAAEAENQKAISGMKFDKNDKQVNIPVKKSIQQMTPKELDEMLDKLI